MTDYTEGMRRPSMQNDVESPSQEGVLHFPTDRARMRGRPSGNGSRPGHPREGALSVADLTSGDGTSTAWHESMFLQHRAGVSASHYLRWKLPLERALGALLLLMSLPILGALVLLVRATSAGPGIYRQPRVGKGGRVFSVYKIRTMRQDAEKDTGPVWSSQGRDPRVTGLGRWLRALHLDELPQLFNVACGDMALIGPRPERPEFVEVLQRHIPGYLDRLVVVPGITGLAQVNLPPDEALEGVWLKTTADLEYIRHASPSMDVKILAATVLRLFGRKISWYVPGRHGVSRANRSEEGVERQGPRADVLPMRDWHRRSRAARSHPSSL
jgi:lipopolysaccharide/colanic/teichoic acid biosynthesis glycosyltransferase